MKIGIVSFTRNGCRINRMLIEQLSCHECEGFAPEKYGKDFELKPVIPSLREWTGQMFREKDAVLFISATGIAVRSIAPFVQSKKTDPAIVVLDEQAKFVISLLSGHIGGANELTEEVAALLHSIPVITTATDVGGKFAVDVFAVKNGCEICEMELAKKVSSVLVDEGSVGFSSTFPVEGTLPEELSRKDPASDRKIGISVSLSEKELPYPETLHLVPKIITLGIGCRKGTSEEKLEKAVQSALAKAGISEKAVFQVSSIDLKAEEPGLLRLCSHHGWKFRTFSTEELKKIPGDFTGSAFVDRVTGVDNVCERSAVLAGGVLLQKKEAGDGVTVAIAQKEWRISF